MINIVDLHQKAQGCGSKKFQGLEREALGSGAV